MPASYSLSYYGNTGSSSLQLDIGNASALGFPSSGNISLPKTTVFVGRNYTSANTQEGYGKAMNQNFMNLTENFANNESGFANTTVYPEFTTGQLVFQGVSDVTFGKGNLLFMITKNGTWATSSKVQILSNANPPTSIADSRYDAANTKTVTSNAAIVSGGGNLVIGINGTPNVVVISSADGGNNQGNSGNIKFEIGSDLSYVKTTSTTGLLTTDRIVANANITAVNFAGANANLTTKLLAQNIEANATVKAVLLEGTLVTAAQPNVTSLGTLTSLDVSGTTTTDELVATTSLSAGAADVATLSATGRITSTVADGTAWLNISSTTLVANLNADLLDGRDSAVAAIANTVVVRDGNGNVTANRITSNTISGSLVTAAQPNVTSLGTLTGLTVGGTGIYGTIKTASQPDITSMGTVTFTDITVTGTISGTVAGNATSTVSGGNASFTTEVTAPQGTFTTEVTAPTGTFSTTVESPSANITNVYSTTVQSTTVQTSTMTTGAAATTGTITGTWTLSSGSTLNATYADLAEYYVSDDQYEPGTVLDFGGTAEVTRADTPGSRRVAGVVSTDPAFVMNEKTNNSEIRTLVALVGRVPCKVVGTCVKGDMMIAAGGGYAKAEANPTVGQVIGKALETKTTTGKGVIEVVVGRL
jgi:hypothetical protein